MRTLLFFILISSISACNLKNSQQQSHQINKSDSDLDKSNETTQFDFEKAKNIKYYLSSTKPDSSDLTMINENCCVFIYPDSSQIAAMKGKTKEDEENFYTVADDYNYYFSEAFKFLDSIQVKQLFPKTRFLKFILSDREILFDTKSKYSSGWLTILFDTSKEPKIVSTVSFQQKYNDFLKEK